MTDIPRGPLDGIRVLDFSRVLAGPACTMLLGDLGADVIKVENPDRGDDTRQWGPPWVGGDPDGLSAYFASINRNKRSLTLNLKSAEGRRIAQELARTSHIAVENFTPGQMAGYSLGYDDLAAINPALVYCSITGFGQSGPYRDLPGYDYVIQAMSGLMAITGPVEGPPYKVGVAISDVVCGLTAFGAILAALHHSKSTGQGQHVDMALLDTQLAALVNVAQSTLVTGEAPPRLGNEHPNIVPYQVFRASDQEFVAAVGNDRQFGLLCELIGLAALTADPRFATNPARVQNRAVLIPLLAAQFARRTAAEWVEALLGTGIPAGPINDLRTILADPHVAARGMVQEVATETGEPLRVVGPPIHLSATPASVRLPPPRLGQHTDEILRDVLSMDEEVIAAHRAAGIV